MAPGRQGRAPTRPRGARGSTHRRDSCGEWWYAQATWPREVRYVFMVNVDEVTGRDFFGRLRVVVWPPWFSSVPRAENDRLTQAKLFVEIARRVDRPLDVLPSGDPALVSAVLWQRAAAWAIAATEDESGVGSAEMRGLLERAAGRGETLAAIESLLRSDLAAPDTTPSMAAAAATSLASFTERLIDELERPVRELRRRRNARAALLIFASVVAVLGVLLIAWRMRPPDLVPDSVRTQSSQWSACTSGECGNALFSTKEEPNPWVQYDFRSERRLHSIAITNRTDCCYERAVPLVVETSNDGRRWKEQVRATEQFMTWSAKLRGRARYVRLRVARTSYLHLSTVIIR